MTDEPTEELSGEERRKRALAPYRFGQKDGNDPKEAKAKQTAAGLGNQHTIRNSLKRLACAEVDITKMPTAEDMAKMFGRDGTKVTMAQLAAIKKFQQAMGNWKAMDSLIDHVDGKQVERKVEATVSLADLVNRSYELEDQSEGDELPENEADDVHADRQSSE